MCGGELPPGRVPYERLVKAVLAWTGPDTLAECDYERIALPLTGHARAVAAGVRRRTEQLPAGSGRRALADVVLLEAEADCPRCWRAPCAASGTAPGWCAALYECLERLEAAPVDRTA